MSKTITGIVDWLKGWFYDKNEVNTYLNAKANKNLTNANMNVVTDSSGDITTEPKPTIPDVTVKADKTGGVQQVTDANSHSNIGTSANATQGAINTAIDTVIGNLSSIQAVKVVSSLPTASASTMGSLYIVSENNKINVYYTKQSGTGSSASYSWQKMDSDILDELSIDWSDIVNKPSFGTGATDFAVGNHAHGNINNDGTISGGVSGNMSGYPIVYVDNNQLAKTQKIWGNQVLYSNYPSAVTVNSKISSIDSTISNKQDVGDCITSIELVPKTTDNTGAIRLYYGDEPS